MKLKNKSVLVYGLGDSGRSAIKLLRKHHAYVSFYDDDIKYMEYVGFEREPEQKHYDLVVVSPGVKCLGNKLIQSFTSKNIPIISELDLAYAFCKGKIVAVTGTNGKTTVCMMVNKVLKSAGYKTFLCGNIGLPFSSICEKTSHDSVVVCEVSSFQLEASQKFRADVCCILNVKPDHLDRHETFLEYKNSKAKIAQNLKRKDVLILNLDDEEAKKMILHRNFKFFSKFRLKKGVSIANNQIYLNKKSILSLNDIHLLGEKNLENVLACVSICSNFKVSEENFSNALSKFIPASHRMEILGEVDGIVFVDDSKATNVASTIACVETFKDKSIVLLMGGKGKNIDYSEFFSSNFKLKKIVCFGEDGENIKNCAKKFGYDAVRFSKFDDAVLFCKTKAEKNDYVLLSPACASFDEFSNYAERGDKFKQLVFEDKDEN